MQLVVEDEEIARSAGLGVCDGLEHLDGMNVEEAAEHFVHGEEGRCHATSAREETAPVDAEFLAGGLRQFLDACLYLFLLARLRNGHVLTVRDHARGDR